MANAISLVLEVFLSLNYSDCFEKQKYVSIKEGTF